MRTMVNKLKQIQPAVAPQASKRLLGTYASDASPLALLLAIARDNDLPLDLRLDAAAKAAPYVHKRQPQMIESTNKTELSFSPTHLKALSKQELETLKTILGKTGVELAPSTGDTLQ